MSEEDIEIIKSDVYSLTEDFGYTVYLKYSTLLDVLESPRKVVNKLKSINI